MSATQEYSTIVRLNTQEAQNQLDKLQKKVEDLRAAKEKALSNRESVKTINQDLKKAEAELKSYQTNVKSTIDTLKNLGSASVKEVKATMKALKREQDKVTSPEEYARLQELIDQCAERMDELKNSTKRAAEESQVLQNQMQNLAKVMQNVGTASMNELKQAESYLVQQMNGMNPNSNAYAIAGKQLQQVRQRVAELNAEHQKLNHTIDQYDQEIKETTKDIATQRREQELVNNTLANLSTTKIRDLQYSLKIVNEELKGMDRGTKEFKAMQDKAKQLQGQLQQLQNEGRKTGNIFSRLWKGLNDNWGAITQSLGAITGLSMTARKAVQAYADMEEKMADTRKYTGMTTAAVRDLNEEFKKMDTRTSREELNELAGAAGRLGLQAKDDVMEFVDAANMISVALGDDLGDGAVDQIGKLAMAFGEKERLGLRGAMLATGSAINELAQNSAAKAGYLVEFAARIAGVGKQAGMTQSQIFGLAAALDEGMMKEEMSATAVSQLLVKMQTDTATFAKITQTSVKEWSDLIKEDFNGALTLLLKKLGEAGNMQTMSKMFDDMGLDGTRCIQVLTKMTDKVDDIAKHQETATKAYKEATSVINEYGVMNDTVQARLDKAKKRFHEMVVSLGEKLEPVVKNTITTFSLLVRVLQVVVEFVFKHQAAIAATTAAIGMYTIAINASNIAFKIHYAWIVLVEKAQKLWVISSNLCALAVAKVTGNVTKATAAMKVLNTVIKANPYVLLASVVLAVAAALTTWILTSDKATEAEKKQAKELENLRNAQNHVKDVQQEAIATAKEEESRIKFLSDAVHNNKLAYEDRAAALKKLREIIPSYHAELTKEGKLIRDNTDAIAEYSNRLIAQATIKAFSDDIARLNKEIALLEAQGDRIKGSISAAEKWRDLFKGKMDKSHGLLNADALRAAGVGAGTDYDKAEDNFNHQVRVIEHHTARLKDNTDALEARRLELSLNQDALKKAMEANKGYMNSVIGNTNTISGSSGGGRNYVSDDEAKAEAKRKAKLEKEAERAEKQRLAKMNKAQREEYKRKKEADKAEKTANEAKILELNQQYSQGLINYREYQERMYALEKEGLENRRKLWAESDPEYVAYSEQLQKVEEQYQGELRQMSIDDVERKYQKTRALLEAELYDEKSARFMNEEAINEALYQADINYLRERQALFNKGSEEWYNLEMEIVEKEELHKIERQQAYAQKLLQYRNEWLQTDVKKQEEITLQGLEDLHNKGMISEEDYQKMLLRIKEYYAEQSYQQEKEEFERERGLKEKSIAKILEKAQRAVSEKDEKQANISGAGIGGDILNIVGTIRNYKTMYEQIEQMRAEDKISEEEAAEAKRQLNVQTMQAVVSQVQAAYNSINQIVNAAAAYSAACSQYEVASITADYDKQIQAAGKNTKKKEKLEKERDKKIKEAKKKANERAMKIEIAQAIASTAMAAINAYASAASIPKIGFILAPIAAGMATAAGLLQIATIKKQHQAEALGYYKGGYTGGRRYRKEAGVVHEGEFVGNHFAVQNPTVRPVFDLIDQAQRNNTIGKLDLPAAMGANGQATVVAPVVNVQTDNSELQGTIAQMNAAISALNAQLEAGIKAPIYLGGHDGLVQKQKEYNKLIKNV